MVFFKRFFSKGKVVNNNSDEIVDNNEEIVDNRSKILFHIHDILSKLELINFSQGETLYLTEKIAFFRNKLDKLEKDYIEKNLADTFLQAYDSRMQYLVSLSILADELDSFSKTYFYLEDLDVLKKTDITYSNLNDKKADLLELDNIIQSYHDPNEELDIRLHEVLIDVIFDFLKKEVKFNQEYQLFDKLSVISRLMIRKKYLEELVHQAKNNLYIQEYLNNNDIETLSFDYFVLAKMDSQEKTLQEKNDLYIPSVIDFDDDDIERLVDKFHDKMDDAILINNNLKIALGYADYTNVVFKIVDRSKKLDYDINAFQVVHISKSKDDYYYFVVSDGKNKKSSVIVGLLFIDFRKKISSYEQKLYMMLLKTNEIRKIVSLVEGDSSISSSNKYMIYRIFSNLCDCYDSFTNDDYDMKSKILKKMS